MSVAGLDSVVNAERGFKAHFFQELETRAAMVNEMVGLLAMTVNSESRLEEHSWSDAIADLVEFEDELEYSRLGLEGFTLRNVKYGRGIAINADDVADDRLGHHIPRIRMLAEKAAEHRLQLLRSLLNDSFTTNHYDGVPLISAAHPRKAGGTQSNLQVGALDATAFQDAVEKLEVLQAEEGDSYLNLGVTHLICGPENKSTARTILNAAFNANGSTNINQGDAEVVIVKGLTSGYWFVGDFSRALKPFVWQDREPISFAAQDRPTDENVFNREEYRYKTRYRGAMGYAFWQLLVGSTG